MGETVLLGSGLGGERLGCIGQREAGGVCSDSCGVLECQKLNHILSQGILFGACVTTRCYFSSKLP